MIQLIWSIDRYCIKIYIDAIRLYDILYDYNSELITVNNTYKEYYNELNKDETKGTINLISISDLNSLFQKSDVNITDVFNNAHIFRKCY